MAVEPRVINTQWLYNEKADIVRSTKTRIIAIVQGKERTFYKKNGYEIGYHDIVRNGCEPNRLINY